MNKEILGKYEWDCQLITKDNKYLGWGDDIHDRAWIDDPAQAITYNIDEIDSNSDKLHGLVLDGTEFIKVTKTIIIKKL